MPSAVILLAVETKAWLKCKIYLHLGHIVVIFSLLSLAAQIDTHRALVRIWNDVLKFSLILCFIVVALMTG